MLALIPTPTPTPTPTNTPLRTTTYACGCQIRLQLSSALFAPRYCPVSSRRFATTRVRLTYTYAHITHTHTYAHITHAYAYARHTRTYTYCTHTHTHTYIHTYAYHTHTYIHPHCVLSLSVCICVADLCLSCCYVCASRVSVTAASNLPIRVFEAGDIVIKVPWELVRSHRIHMGGVLCMYVCMYM